MAYFRAYAQTEDALNDLGVSEDALKLDYREDGWGAAAHDPKMTLTLLTYACCVGEPRSRRCISLA